MNCQYYVPQTLSNMLSVTLCTHNQWQWCCYCVFLFLLTILFLARKLSIPCVTLYTRSKCQCWAVLALSLISLPWRNGLARNAELPSLQSPKLAIWLITHAHSLTMLIDTMITIFDIINKSNILNYECYITLYILNIEYLGTLFWQ